MHFISEVNIGISWEFPIIGYVTGLTSMCLMDMNITL